ncbi:hypothetical protein J6590_089611 [Homalodisca vitripennis]|nr:hypothetical protein J6590_089611 [Homalodisca vitripennis]
MSELVPANDLLDEQQTQSLRAPEVELQYRKDDARHNSSNVCSHSHGPAICGQNHVSEDPEKKNPEKPKSECDPNTFHLYFSRELYSFGSLI